MKDAKIVKKREEKEQKRALKKAKKLKKAAEKEHLKIEQKKAKERLRVQKKEEEKKMAFVKKEEEEEAERIRRKKEKKKLKAEKAEKLEREKEREQERLRVQEEERLRIQKEEEKKKKAEREEEEERIKRKMEKKMFKKLEKKKLKAEKKSKKSKQKDKDSKKAESKLVESESKNTVTLLSVPVPVRNVIDSSTTTNTNTTPTTKANVVITPPASKSTTPIRKAPVSIRTPGSNRVNPEINPIYTAASTKNVSSSSLSIQPRIPNPNDFIIPGFNDTEQSKLLTRTFASKWGTLQKLQEIEKQTGLKYVRGRFSEQEQILGEKLTSKYCLDHGITLEDFKRAFFDEMSVLNRSKLTDFFVSVSQHFGGRPVVSVYDFLKRKYHPGNHRGPWNSEDDQALLRGFKKHGPRWTIIGKDLNREAHNCRDRFNTRWKHVERAVYGPWSQEDHKVLIDAVKESMERTGTISWIWISEERVKNRTPLQCLSRWQTTRASETADKPKAPPAQKSKSNGGNFNGWKDDEDYLLIHAILTGTGESAASDEQVDWRSLTIPSLPALRHNPETFFRRWNYLKLKSEISENEAEKMSLKALVEKIKKYLLGVSKTPAYIFSEDEEMDF